MVPNNTHETAGVHVDVHVVVSEIVFVFDRFLMEIKRVGKVPEWCETESEFRRCINIRPE